MKRKSLIAALSLFVVAGLATTLGLEARSHADATQGGKVVQLKRLVFEGDFIEFPTLARLTQVSPEVVGIKYVARLASYGLPVDAPVHNDAPLPAPQGNAAVKAGSGASPIAGSPGVRPQTQPLVTDFTAEVIRTLKGSGLKPGDTITLTAHGGQSSSVSEVMQGERLPQVGAEEVVFLVRNQVDSSKFAFVNPQGRFAVNSSGMVVALEQSNPVARAYSNTPLARFENAILAVLAAPLN